MTTQMAAQQSDIALIDHDFVDFTQPHRVLYKCTVTGLAATEVRLQRSATLELLRTREVLFRDVMQDTRFRMPSANAAEVVIQMCNKM